MNAGRLNLVVAPDAAAVAAHAAARIEQALSRQPDLLLCAAAGSSPTRTYQLLGQAAASVPDRFRQLRIVKVDEWGGLSMDNPATCEADLRSKLLGPLRIAPDRYRGFRSDAADPARECENMSQWLAEHGPIDLCVLGLGLNGHLAMNEPSEALCPVSHVAQLTASSLQHPMLAASDVKPHYGLTLGMGEILRSRQILLLVSGPAKRAALQRLLEPAVTTRFPASLLWLHPNAMLLSDQEAAAGLP